VISGPLEPIQILIGMATSKASCSSLTILTINRYRHNIETLSQRVLWVSVAPFGLPVELLL
jgi:hypothetical protein